MPARIVFSFICMRILIFIPIYTRRFFVCIRGFRYIPVICQLVGIHTNTYIYSWRAVCICLHFIETIYQCFFHSNATHTSINMMRTCGTEDSFLIEAYICVGPPDKSRIWPNNISYSFRILLFSDFSFCLYMYIY